jgi:hypothetical protein
MDIPLVKMRLETTDSAPRVVLPPSRLFQIQECNRYKDQGKTIATMGLMEFWSVKLFQHFSSIFGPSQNVNC